MLRQWRREVPFFTLNEIILYFCISKKGSQKRKLFIFLSCFNFIQWPKLWFSSFLFFLCTKIFIFLFLLKSWILRYQKKNVAWGSKKIKEYEGRHKEKCRKVNIILPWNSWISVLMVKLDSFKVVISWIIPYLMEHGILFNLINAMSWGWHRLKERKLYVYIFFIYINNIGTHKK